MPTFETVPDELIEEALAATVALTWLEERFGKEHDSSWDTDEVPSYIVSDGNDGVYESILSGSPKSILFFEEAKELMALLKPTGRRAILFRVILEEVN